MAVASDTHWYNRKINPKQPGEKPVEYFSDLPASNSAELILSGSEDSSHTVTVSLSSHTSLRE